MQSQTGSHLPPPVTGFTGHYFDEALAAAMAIPPGAS
jgi:hypothetical protein